MDDELVLDVDGNPVTMLEEQLQLLIDAGLAPELLPAGDGTENNGDLPKVTYLI